MMFHTIIVDNSRAIVPFEEVKHGKEDDLQKIENNKNFKNKRKRV